MKCKLKPSDQLTKILEEILLSEKENLMAELIITATEKVTQEALESEMSDFLGRGWYEHTPDDFRGYRNGYQPKRYKTAEGVLNLMKPRVRGNEIPFESQIIKRLNVIEEKLKHIALESYVRGLSTRDIEETFQDDQGKALLSRSSVSQMSSKLYKDYEEFASRDLSNYDVVYMYVDAVYESVKQYTNKQAIFCCWAICSDGTKQLLHIMAADKEKTDSWNVFFEDMLNRGLRQPLLIVSDGSQALIRAITESFPRAERQRCIAHKMRNLLAKIPQDSQTKIKNEIHSIYYAPDRDTADVLSEKFIKNYADVYPSMIKCFMDDLNACLTHLKYPEGHQKYIRTTNLIERAFVEEKRRTKIIPQHINEKGAIGLVFSVLIRAAEKWRKITMSELDLTQLLHLRKLMVPEITDDNKISYKTVA